MVLIDSSKDESSMETCVLLPQEFSLRIEKPQSPPPLSQSSPYGLLGNFLPSFLSPLAASPGIDRDLTGDPTPAALRNIFSNCIRVCASKRISVRTQFMPFAGTIRTDNLPLQPPLAALDVRHRMSCYDEVVERDGKSVRFCNWVRFVRCSLNLDQDVNMVATKNEGSVIFEVIREVPEGTDLVVYQMPDTTTPGDPFSLSAIAMLRSSIYRQTLDSIMSDTPLDLSRSLLSATSSSSAAITKDLPKESKDKFENVHKDDSRSVKEEKSEPILRGFDYRKICDSENVNPLNGGSFLAPFFSPSPALHRFFPFSLPPPGPPPPSFIRPQFSLPSVSPHISERIHSVSKSQHSNFTNSPSSSLGSSETASLNLTSIQPKRRERTMLPCSECGKAFDRPSLLKRHMRTHTGEKPHVCDVCGKGFSTSSSLNTHRRIHSGEKPHQCGVCGKRFTASSNLYYHKMTHIKEKPHKCSLCTRSFPTPGDLRSHMFVHNGQWPHKCTICGKGFSKLTNLKNHAILHSERQSKRTVSPSSPEGRSSTPTSVHISSPSSSSALSISSSPIATSLPASLFSTSTPPSLFVPPSPPISPPVLKNTKESSTVGGAKVETIKDDVIASKIGSSDSPGKFRDSSSNSEDEHPPSFLTNPNNPLKFPFSPTPAFFSLMSSPFFSFPHAIAQIPEERAPTPDRPATPSPPTNGEDDLNTSSKPKSLHTTKLDTVQEEEEEKIDVDDVPKEGNDVVCDLTVKSVDKVFDPPERSNPLTLTNSLTAEVKDS